MTTTVKPLMDLKDVIAVTKVCRSTLWKMVKDGRFPKPIKLGRDLRWKPETVQSWLDSLEAAE